MPRKGKTKFSQELWQTILERMADGESLNTICKSRGMPSRITVSRWMNEDEANARFGGQLRNEYARAREKSADADFERIKEISEDTLKGLHDPQAARVAIDAIKWTAGRMKPKKYGDRISHDHQGTVSIRIGDEDSGL